jgi:hypothetical protein
MRLRASILLLGVVFVSSLFLSVNSGSAAVQTTSLCTKGEKVVFSCALKSSTKTVSLCSSQKLTKSEGYLQYRFGVPG